MRRAPKLLTLVLSVIIVLSILPVLPLNVSAETEVFEYSVSDGAVIITGLINKNYSGELTIPSTVGGYPVTSIGFSAFAYCNKITGITIPDSVTTIGGVAFLGCTGLKKITVPNSVTSIGLNAFFGCAELKTAGPVGGGYDYEFGWTKNIPDSAFYSCGGLRSVTVPNSITRIGNDVFSDCIALKSIVLGSGIASIGDGAFINCVKLTKVNYTGNIANWCKISFFDYDSNPLCYAYNLYINDKLVTDLVIPGSVTEIGNYAFEGCTGLTSVTIPDSVTKIGNNAFYDCNGLTSVIIGKGVKSIGKWAFYDCTELAEVIIPDSVTLLSDGAFRGCAGLESITIPYSVVSIGDSAFTGCNRLVDVCYTGTKQQRAKINVNNYNDCLLNAKWYYNCGKAYKITYKLNGGKNSPANSNSYTVSNKDTVLQNPARTGYAFGGWYSGSEKVTKISKGTTGNITLTAKWKIVSYNIAYKLAGGKNNGKNPKKYNVTTSTITLKSPTKKGYKFLGWYSGSKKVTKIKKGTTGKITLTAKWEAINYKITYKLNKGKNNAENPNSYKVTSAVNLKNPTRKGYTFKGWYNGSKKVTKIAKGSTGNITLTAKWAKKK